MGANPDDEPTDIRVWISLILGGFIFYQIEFNIGVEGVFNHIILFFLFLVGFPVGTIIYLSFKDTKNSSESSTKSKVNKGIPNTYKNKVIKNDNQYYVYAHINPITGDTFYVGKGSGNRAYDREKRNDKWQNKVKEINGKFDVKFIQKNLTEMEAFELEFVTIKEIGKEIDGGTLVNITDGGAAGLAKGPFPIPPETSLKDNYINPFDDESQWKSKEEKNLYRYINSRKQLDSLESAKMIQEIRSKLDIFQDTYHKLNMRNDEVTSSGIGTEIEMAIGYDIEDDEIWTPFLSKYIDGNSDYRILIKDLIDTQCNLESEIEEDDFFDEDEDEYQELRKIAQDIITFYQSIIDKYFPRKQ